MSPVTQVSGRTIAGVVTVASVAALTAVLVTTGRSESPASASVSNPERSAAVIAAPELRTRVVMRDLDIPWDVAVLPGGDLLVTERDRERIVLRRPSGRVRVLAETPSGVWHSGETGLMSIATDPRVGNNGRFYTCHGYMASGAPEIRVVAWRISDAHTTVRRLGPLLTGIQITTGRHGGCRIRFGGDGSMYVGTGDSAVGRNPQNLRSLNGKVLRLDRFSGRPWPGNPFVNADARNKRFVFTYGHRNVQGLALRPGGSMWSVEHGSFRDDEVNRLRKGGNYGWNPVPGYNESVPMTDFGLPGPQVGARWSSGNPTLATSGATWVQGTRWGALQGTLAVCTLKSSKLLFITFDDRGGVLRVRTPKAMNGTFGRLRSVTQTPRNALLVTTSNGGGNDRVVKVTPR